MKRDVQIRGTAPNGIKYEEVTKLLETLGLENLKIVYHSNFDEWLVSLPDFEIPGMADYCIDWIRCWGNGGGDLSTETFIKDDIRGAETNNPKILAEIIYYSIADEAKPSFEAQGLTMELINECISDIKHDRLPYAVLKEFFKLHEAGRPEKGLTAHIVFTAESYSQDYTEKQRTYVVSSKNNAFMPESLGNSIYGVHLDGHHQDVRLDLFMVEEKGNIKGNLEVEYCYIVDPNN